MIPVYALLNIVTNISQSIISSLSSGQATIFRWYSLEVLTTNLLICVQDVVQAATSVRALIVSSLYLSVVTPSLVATQREQHPAFTLMTKQGLITICKRSPAQSVSLLQIALTLVLAHKSSPSRGTAFSHIRQVNIAKTGASLHLLICPFLTRWSQSSRAILNDWK